MNIYVCVCARVGIYKGVREGGCERLRGMNGENFKEAEGGDIDCKLR